MIHAKEGEIVLVVVGPVLIHVSDLPKLFCQVAMQMKTKCTTTPTLLEHLSFDIGRGPLARRFRLRHGFMERTLSRLSI